VFRQGGRIRFTHDGRYFFVTTPEGVAIVELRQPAPRFTPTRQRDP
jgi:hypothetical protein